MPAFHKKPASFSLFLPMKWRIFNGKNSQKFKRFKKFKKFTVPSLKLSESAVQWIKTWQTLAYLTTKDVFCTISTVIRSFVKPGSSSRFPQRIYTKQAIQHSFFCYDYNPRISRQRPASVIRTIILPINNPTKLFSLCLLFCTTLS